MTACSGCNNFYIGSFASYHYGYDSNKPNGWVKCNKCDKELCNECTDYGKHFYCNDHKSLYNICVVCKEIVSCKDKEDCDNFYLNCEECNEIVCTSDECEIKHYVNCESCLESYCKEKCKKCDGGCNELIICKDTGCDFYGDEIEINGKYYCKWCYCYQCKKIFIDDEWEECRECDKYYCQKHYNKDKGFCNNCKKN